MKTAILPLVYRMNPALSTGVHGPKKAGFLLIELMIALATLAVCSLLIARLQAHMVCQCYEAEQYLKAATCASRVFEERSFGKQELDGFGIKTTVQSVRKSFPYTHVSVTVSWNSSNGISKQITMHGGMLDENQTV